MVLVSLRGSSLSRVVVLPPLGRLICSAGRRLKRRKKQKQRRRNPFGSPGAASHKFASPWVLELGDSDPNGMEFISIPGGGG